ncbi:MAG: tetratricopeptide repeat protein [Bacteroidota bacterium]|nr:tetratricopeptide repeat protein [Bacteroidota bacterium]
MPIVQRLLQVGVLLTCLGWLTPQAAHGQTDLELAEFYYNEGSYPQAKLYLEGIWKKNKTNAVYTMYYATLLALDDFDTAEKVVKERLKRRHKNSRSTALVDLGSLYLHFDRREQALEAFMEALENLQPGRPSAVSLANAFIKLDELDMALATYERAEKLGTTGFDYELANLQGMRGDFEGMIDAYMALLSTKPNYLRTVQNSLNRNLRLTTIEDNRELVRVSLLRAIQKYPDNTVFPELLVWHFNQIRDFASSVVHAKALDLRLDEQGVRLMELGNTAQANGDTETALECYRYVASMGPRNPYYFTARNEVLQVRFEVLTAEVPADLDAMAVLAEEYAASLRDLGVRSETAMMVKDRAHLLAFYLRRAEEGIEALEALLAENDLNDRVAAACKLTLGDIYVFEGLIWDASLLFSQIVLDFKDDPLGHEAKFRNARVSYFGGDFNWAQSQLNALKASTSKLISNDAIDLSLLITDNFNLDTLTLPMEMYARADLLRMQRKFDVARTTLDSLTKVFPGHVLEDEVLMMSADMFLEQDRLDTAMTLYQEVVDLHFDDITGDDALWMLADLTHNRLGDLATAQTLYEKLLFDFPGSLHAVEARKRFRALRGDELE